MTLSRETSDMAISRVLKLNTGHTMPIIGFGTYMLTGEALKEALDYALFVGYRHIDTATAYGNEADIGQVVEDRQRSGKLNRKDLFITSKVPNTRMSHSAVLESTQESLQALKTNYLDMLLIHSPWACTKRDNKIVAFQNVNLMETWDAVTSIFNSGYARSVGVSNFTIKQLNRILVASKAPLSNVQLECHAYLQQRNLKSYCDSRGIIVSAYAPLGAPNRPSHHVNSNLSLLHDPVVTEIAERYRKTPAQILLNFLLRQRFVVLPKSGTKARIKANFEATDVYFANEDLELISSLNKGQRFFTFSHMKGHHEYFDGDDF